MGRRDHLPVQVTTGRRSLREAGPDRAAALALALVALLAVSPVVLVDTLWSGAFLLGAGIGEDGLYAGLGVVIFAAGALPLGMLTLVAPVSSGRRWAQALACALSVAVALISLTPVRGVSALSWLPGGRWLLLALALLAALLLLRAWRPGRERPRPGPASRVPVAAGAAIALLLAAGAIAGASGNSIPGTPSAALVADLKEGPQLTGAPLDARPPAADPALAPGQGSNIHNDAAMSDTYYGRSVVDPATADIRSFRALGDCGSILFERAGNLVAICVGGTRIVAYLLDPSTLEPLAELQVASRSPGPDSATNFSGGGYAVLDRRGRLIVPTADGGIQRFRIDSTPGAAAIEPLDEFDVSASLAPDEPITSALPDWSGALWFVGSQGTVGVLDPDSGEARSIRFEGADIENSFVPAPGGGAFVVTSEQLIRLEIGPDGAPRTVWTEPYDSGVRQKPGQSSRASGTTPTLMLGGRFVAITDNAEPQMHVLVFRAAPSVRGERLLCEVGVFEPGESATENSLIAAGRSIFVENNYGYGLFDVVGGHSSSPGAARIDLDPAGGGCEPVWANDEIRIPSVVSKVSAADGTMLTYAKPELASGVDAWYFTALDAGTGEVLWQRLAGTGPLANNHYAGLYVGPSGNLYVGTLGGVIGLVGGDDRPAGPPRRLP